MKRVWTILKRFFFGVLPFVEAWSANNRLVRKLNATLCRTDSGHHYDSVELNDLLVMHSRSENSRFKIEDKARLSFIGISVAVSIVGGVGFQLANRFLSDQPKILEFALVVCLMIATAYLLSAGLLSLRIIGNLNEAFYLGLGDLSEPEDHRKQVLVSAIELTNLQNIRRNNLMYASFRCLANGLVVFVSSVVLYGIFAAINWDWILKPLSTLVP